MSDQVIRIAATPVDIDNLGRYLSERLTGQPVSINKQSTDRDVSILSILISTATESAVTLVFNLLKEYLTNKLIKPDIRDSKATLAIESGDVKITVPTNISPDQLDHLLKAVRGNTAEPHDQATGGNANGYTFGRYNKRLFGRCIRAVICTRTSSTSRRQSRGNPIGAMGNCKER